MHRCSQKGRRWTGGLSLPTVVAELLVTIITARCIIVQSAVLRLQCRGSVIVRPSRSVSNVGGSGPLRF